MTSTGSHDHGSEAIRRTLHAAREHLALDVAFVSEFVGDRRVFRYVDHGEGSAVLEVGGSDPLDESYCHYVVKGEVPEFLEDPSKHPVTAAMPVTCELPVGTHLSVPVRFSDGRVYGTFCCFSRSVRTDLVEGDLRAVRLLAELVGDYLEEIDRKDTEQRRRRVAVQNILSDPNGLKIVFQPLFDLTTEEIVAVEALARFPSSAQGPAPIFREAAEVGLGVPLELKAVDAALRCFDALPSPLRMNVNLSPEALTTDAFAHMVTKVPPNRLMVEVTEHAVVEDQVAMEAARQHLSSLGIGTSIDDVGAGFSGLTRILQAGADELKIDRSIVQGVDRDPVKQAMISALAGFCRRTGFDLVAEGIETEDELRALRSLGIERGQGFYFARPAPLEVILGTSSPSNRMRSDLRASVHS